MAETKQEKYEESMLYKRRHSAAHIMAQAVLEKFPTAKIAIGPAIEDGYYYDFDLPRPLTPEDLEGIEKRMREIIKSGVTFERRELSADAAKKIFHDQPYKIELIEGLEKGTLDDNGNPVEEKPVMQEPAISLQVGMFRKQSQALRAQRRITSKLHLPVEIVEQWDYYYVIVTGFYTREDTFKYYFYFIQERMNMFWNKYNCQNAPWTNDNILSVYKFTNVYKIGRAHV